MGSEIGKRKQSSPEFDVGVKRRGMLRLGSLITAFTGASAISALSASSAHAGPGDKNPPTSYVPTAEKGVASGVATLDLESKIPTVQLPDLSATYAPAGKTVYVESFRDGSRTDTQIITAAFAALTPGGSLKFGQGKTYTLATASAYDLTSKPNVFIDGQGATLDGSAVASGVILQIKGGSGSVTTTLIAALTSRSRTLTVASTAGFTAGDMISIRSDAEPFNSDRSTAVKQEMARVDEVADATTLTLESRTWNAYSTSGYKVTVKRLPAMKNLCVSDLNLKGAGGGSNQSGIQFAYFDGLNLSNVFVDGVGIEGLAGSAGMDLTAVNCRVQGSNASGLGYGFHVTQAQNVKFIGCFGRKNRHSFDVDEVRDVLYDGCTAEGDSSAGISTHGSVDVAKIINNTVKDCGGGIVSRGRNTVINGNHIVGSRTTTDSSESYIHGITLGDDGPHTWGTGIAGTGLVIRDNYIDMSGPNWAGVESFGIYSTAALVDAEISDNRIFGYSAHGILAKGDYALRLTFRNNRLDGSGQLGTYGTTASHGIYLAPAHAVSGNTLNEVEFDGNRISYALHSGIRVKGNPTSAGPVSDNLVFKNNIISDCGVTRIHVADGYYGSRIEIWANEWLGISDTAAPVTVQPQSFYLAPPFIGANGFAAKGVRLLEEGREAGARLRPSMYYASPATTGTSQITLNRLSATPIFIGRRITVDRIGFNVTAPAAAGGTAQLAIYADVLDGVGGYPGALVTGTTGSVATDTSGFKEASISAVLNPGLYWLALVPQVAAPSATVITGAGYQTVGYQGSGAVLGRAAYVQDSVTAALPSVFTSSANAQGVPPQVQVRVAR
jgi:hypothetical protein